MSEVISLATIRTSREPTAAAEESLVAEGEARCAGCGHRWHAVVPDGVRWLECPSCHLHKGLFVHPFSAPEGGYQWRCHCGCDVFYIVPAAVRCVSCGNEQAGY